MLKNILEKPFVKKNTILRKGIPFAVEPLNRVKRKLVDEAQFTEQPPIFVNSLPKSGTHALLQICKAFPKTDYRGRFIASSPSISQKPRSSEEVARSICKILPGEVLGCHLFYSKKAEDALKAINAVSFFIYRDPRDVILSEINYLSSMNRWHRMHRHFSTLEAFDDKLKLALEGHDARYPSANERFRPYFSWLKTEGVITIRYEDLFGSKQEDVVKQICETYTERTGLRPSFEDALSSLNPSKSHTFSKGGLGRWRSELSCSEQEKISVALFEALEAFGYS